MTATITIYGPYSMIKGNYPFHKVREATSYPVEGFQYSQAYRKGVWDGRKHLMKKSGAFPTGLVSIVKQVCEEEGVTPEIVDERNLPTGATGSFDLEGITMTGKRDYQLEAAKKAVEQKQGILKMATNAGKTEVSAAITNYLRLPTLFVVTSKELLYQAQKRFLARLPGVVEEDVGLIGDGIWRPGNWVTVATVDTLESRLSTPDCKEFLSSIDVLFIDECHHVGSETWYQVSVVCAAYYRFGLSGTPLDRTDGANLRLIAATGPIIVDIPNKFLVERGISAKANILWDKVTSPILGPRVRYATAYKKGVVENANLTQKIIQWTQVCVDQGLSVLILVDEIKHGNILDDALWTQTDGGFISHQFIHGQESGETRAQALQDFGDRRLPVLIASTILDEGVDVPTIDVLICAGSKKSRIRTMQRLGRGLRGEKLIVIEFCHFTNKYLQQHSLQRYEDYKKEECFPQQFAEPSEELIKKLWGA